MFVTPRRRRGLGLALGLAGVLALAACGGGGGGSDAGAGTPDTPTWQTTLSWDFSSSADWQLQADDVDHARAVIDAGRLALAAQAYVTDPQGDLQCPLAAAAVSLDAPAVSAPGLQAWALEFHVQRWDLALGPFDSDVPQLELVLRGQRYRIGVAGFKQMPGLLRLDWTAAQGLVSSYDGVSGGVVSPVGADGGTPMLQLSIDGCSEGGAQSLEIDRVELLTR